MIVPLTNALYMLVSVLCGVLLSYVGEKKRFSYTIMDVLVLEDDVVCASALSVMLETCVNVKSITIADNASKALDMIDDRQLNEEAQFGLCIFDIGMSYMDGTEAVRVLRRCERAARTSHIRVVGCSADAYNRTKALSAGMNEFLIKPVTLQQVKKMVKGCK